MKKVYHAPATPCDRLIAHPDTIRAYLKDVFERLPSLPASRIAELRPYNWKPAAARSKPKVKRTGGLPDAYLSSSNQT